MIDVLYFAWVRERIGLPRERIDTNAATVNDLIAELSAALNDPEAGAKARLDSLGALAFSDPEAALKKLA